MAPNRAHLARVQASQTRDKRWPESTANLFALARREIAVNLRGKRRTETVARREATANFRDPRRPQTVAPFHSGALVSNRRPFARRAGARKELPVSCATCLAAVDLVHSLLTPPQSLLPLLPLLYAPSATIARGKHQYPRRQWHRHCPHGHHPLEQEGQHTQHQRQQLHPKTLVLPIVVLQEQHE